MTQHLICLTIDTDPDSLNQHEADRMTLDWAGLAYVMDHLHDALPGVPLTWYVRADGQLEKAYGDPRYLFTMHQIFWKQALQRGDELGWHPHLYRADGTIMDAVRAAAELERLWPLLQSGRFALPTFRMGEGWQMPALLALLEQFGFAVDSSCIPGRDDSASAHPRNWAGAPNRPYFPAFDDVRQVGPTRALLEVPMNSWRFQASYDQAPKLRYMNPCVHERYWQQALHGWAAQLQPQPLYVWVLIFHPAEAMPQAEPDLLYAHSLEAMRANLDALAAHIKQRGGEPIFTTVLRAAQRWRATLS